MKRNLISTLLVLVLVVLILPPGLVMAVEEFRVSEYGGGVQIWFQVEAFDERNPAGGQYFKVTGEPGAPKAPDGAFGEAMTRAGGAGGMIRWTFDISRTEWGEAGVWHFWGRITNPSNQSDYMLVAEDRDDDDIPEGPPFPGGDGVPPFDNPDDRIFEQNVAAWGWWGNSDGSDKELQDGENTMFIYHRQGNNTVFWDVFMWANTTTYVPGDDDYANAKVMEANIAVQPVEKLSITWGSVKDAAHPE